MKILLKITLIAALSGFTEASFAQIVFNGPNPGKRHSRASYDQPRTALSISFTSVLWLDGKSVPLPGYSSTLSEPGELSAFSFETVNLAAGAQLAYDRKISERLLVNLAFMTARMVSGTILRSDLDAIEKSRLSQLGIYASWSLTRNLNHRVQFQCLTGPEVIYARKRVQVFDYVTDVNPEPQTFNQKLDVVEVSAVTGLGISFRIAGDCSLYANSLFGIALPGKGLKITNSGLGFKVGF